MKNQILITLLIVMFQPFFAQGQTTLEEYDFLTKTYPETVAKGQTPEKTGYYFQELLDMVDKSGKVRLLYKEEQISVIPTATQIQVNDGEKIYYICLPHEDSEQAIFDKYAADLQQLFDTSPEARRNYSKIMLRYPKQLQKFYDEIKALENTADVPATINTAKAVDVPPSRPIEPELTEAQPIETEPEPIVEETTVKPKEEIIILETEPETRTSAKRQKSKVEINQILTRREVIETPEIYNSTVKVGKVRVDICINAQGQVVSANYNRISSESRDEELIEQALKLSKQYRFGQSHLSRQCGFVVFDFK